MRRTAGIKDTIQSKVCRCCGKPFQWRKKWELNWSEVKYCSKRCSRNKKKSNE